MGKSITKKADLSPLEERYDTNALGKEKGWIKHLRPGKGHACNSVHFWVTAGMWTLVSVEQGNAAPEK